jgi:L-aspartate oxidase
VPDWQVGNAVAERRGGRRHPQLGRAAAHHVELRRHRPLERAGSGAPRRIAMLQEEIREYYWKHLVTRDLLELRNIATVAELIVGCASARHESRGLHSTIDYPGQVARARTSTRTRS